MMALNRRCFLRLVGTAGGLGGALAGWRIWDQSSPELEQARPLSVRPFPLDSFPIDQKRLQTALRFAAPCHRLSYPDVVHALRVWGTGASRSEPGCFSGGTLLAILLDDQAATTFFPGKVFVEKNARGWYHRFAAGSGDGDSHPGYSLSALAELEIPLTHPVRVAGEVGCVRDLLRGALWQFSWSDEWEWWLAAFARYLPTGLRWRNKNKETVSLPLIAERLCARSFGAGECYGTHALLSLVTLLRADEVKGLLDRNSHATIERHVRIASNLLSKSQAPSGFWGPNWHGFGDSQPEPTSSEKLVVTGHTLEWLAWCPQEFRPAPRILEHAIMALSEQMLAEGLNPWSGTRSFAAYTHAARALRLFKGDFPL